MQSYLRLSSLTIHILLNDIPNFISPDRANYFGDLVKKETGKSAIEYIHLAVIGRVKDLLMGTDKTVSEIAYEVGFQYPHHLSRMFKKIAGCSPLEYQAGLS